MKVSGESFLVRLKDSRSRICRKLSRAVLYVALSLVWLYQVSLSPFLGGHCRFQPTCSEYAKECLKSHNFFRSLYLIFRRLSVCHPFGRAGFDPAPISVRSENV